MATRNRLLARRHWWVLAAAAAVVLLAGGALLALTGGEDCTSDRWDTMVEEAFADGRPVADDPYFRQCADWFDSQTAG